MAGNNDVPWSTPKLSPLYPNFPIEYKDVQILSTVYRSDPKAIAEHLTAPITSAGDYVMIHNYFMPDVAGMGVVQESNVMVGVKVTADGVEHSGGFSTNLIISSDVGLAQGREVHGQPKKLGHTTIDVRGDTIVAEVERNGITVARVTTPYRYQKATIDELTAYFPFRENINHKVIRNIDGSLGIHQITSRILADVVVKDCWKGPSTLVLEPNINANLYRLPVLETIESFYWKADFTLVPGTILIDFLKGSK
ncbi:MAG: acetoacetate decarboxylase family protein [Actinomycetota bacterium]